MNKDLNVCLVPMQIDWDDKQSNIQRLEKIMDQVHPDTDLVILPETFSTGFPVGKDLSLIHI